MVKQFYQDTNHGPNINIQFEVMTSSLCLCFVEEDNDWACTADYQLNQVSMVRYLIVMAATLHIQVMRQDILSYDGTGKPPTCELTFKAVSSMTDIPPDLKRTMKIDGIKKPNTIQIERMAEHPAITTLNFRDG